MILIKRGPFDKMEILEDGRLYFASDKKDLYIGSSNGNVKLSDNNLIFEAKMSQAGTGSPSEITKYKDLLPGSVAWSRDSTGEYRGTLANAFDVDTYVEIINLEPLSVNINKGGYINDSNIYITQRNNAGTLTDSIGNFMIKIYRLIPI